jgi:hypothetical protein
MGQKDITEKLLEDYNDVFADIINGLIFKGEQRILPVMTIVLYFGTDHHWYGKKNIKGLMKIPEGLEEYINDYEMKVFEIAWLTEEEISRFHSDFKVVANFFVQKRKHKDYIPDDPTEIRHIDEVLKLLRVMTGDERYQAIFQKERGVHSMCDVAERLEKMGMEKGIEKGMEQGVKQGRKLGRNEGIHEEKVRVYKKLLEKGFSKQEAQEITELPQFLEN